MDKILTIVIPTYNMEKYLRKCLDSLIIDDKELFGKLEVLVVNDGSKDSSSAIAHEYQDNYPNVFRVIDKENGNYGSCVNRGLKEANGKYIKILDADDYFDTKNFEMYLQYVKNIEVDLVLNDCILVNQNKKKLQKWSIIIDTFQELNFHYDFAPQMHCVTYCTEILRQINYAQSEGISYTDQEWVFYPMAAIKTVYYIPLVLYYYLMGREGQTMDKDIYIQKFGHEFEINKKMISFVESQTEISDDVKVYLRNKIVSKLGGIYKRVIVEYGDQRNCTIIEFENSLKKDAPSFYILMNTCVLSKYVPFHMVRYWRKHDFHVGQYLPAVVIDKMACKIIDLKKRIASRFL